MAEAQQGGPTREPSGSATGSAARRGLDAVNWPGLWAPLAAVAAYVGTVFFVTVGVLSGMEAPPPTIPVSVAAWANLAGLFTLGLVSLLLVTSANGAGSLGRLVALGGRLSRGDFALAAGLLVVVVPIGTLIGWALLGRGVPIDPVTTQILTHPVSQAGAVLVAPLAEELWGRGLVYGALRRWGPAVAVVGSALVTAGLHLDLVRIVSVFPAMLALSWLRHRTGRLAPSVVLHAGNNALALVLSLLGT